MSTLYSLRTLRFVLTVFLTAATAQGLLAETPPTSC